MSLHFEVVITTIIIILNENILYISVMPVNETCVLILNKSFKKSHYLIHAFIHYLLFIVLFF